MRRRVFVHVGSPKSGTTGVQDTLWRNRGVLAEHGVHYPADRFDEHFLAALDLQQLTWGGLEDQAVGVFDRLIERINAVEGSVVLSSEVFAAASAEQAQRFLGAVNGETHVVFSARDLARQIPAEWQELVKHRHRVTYADFLADLAAGSSTRRESQWFWSVQHWPQVLERWGSGLPPERVHVVTVPRPGADRSILTGRFWNLFGIDPAWLPETSPRANVGLDPAAATALRRLNERLPSDRLASRHYRPLVREAIVHRGMTGRPDTPRVTLPSQMVIWASRLCDEWVQQLHERGYDVVGDLAELRVDEDTSTWQDPDEVAEHELLEAGEQMLDLAVCSAAELFDQLRDVRGERDTALEESATLREELVLVRMELDRLGSDLALTRATADELSWLREHPRDDAKRRLVVAAQGHASLRVALDLYRAVRDRTRRT